MTDRYLRDRRTELDKLDQPLETLAEQFSVIPGNPDPGLVLAKLAQLKVPDRAYLSPSAIETWSIFADWKKGDTMALQTSTSATDSQLGGFVTKRNRKWMEKLPIFFRDSQVHAAFPGAGHLFGAEGVIQLLQDEGFKVQPWDPDMTC